MLRYEEPVIRPPSEADSLILQATIGCSHNRCAFCVTYQDKRFRARPMEELLSEIDWAADSLPEIRKVFLGDGDALALSTEKLLTILGRLRDRLPGLRRISAYASPMNFRHKSVGELKKLREAGLSMLYVGLESGDDDVLCRINKGAGAEEMATLCTHPTEAGMTLFVTVILGLGGPRLSMQHATQTARLIDRVKPRFASALTLMLPPRQPSYQDVYDDPDWRPLDSEECLVECRQLLREIRSNRIVFYSNHASNYLPLRGTLQKDKDKMLASLDAAIRDPNRRMPEYLRGL
ncbi:MAG: radical SAM protein [Proteobacteria bacterium]|nr:radical SAM protein [Pseudomonadota bacterium]